MTVSLGVDIGLAILVLAVTVWTITVAKHSRQSSDSWCTDYF